MLHFKFKKDVIIYGVRVGTGNPSKTHIINDATGSSYCGYDNYVAEVSVVSADETVFKPNFCKKCLKGYEKTN